MNTNEFTADRNIDPNELDVAVLEQPDLYFKWAKRAVMARSEESLAKLQRDTSEAYLQLECRKDPDAFGIVKVTEVAIDAAVKNHPKYAKAHKDYIKAREVSMLMDRAVDAMDQRQRELQLLVTLHGQSYFAGPSVPRDLAAEYKEHTEKREASLQKRQAARVRKRKTRKEGKDDAD